MLLEWINLKIKNTFIHIDEDFIDLDFNYEWNKHL